MLSRSLAPRLLNRRELSVALAVAFGLRLLCLALFAYKTTGGDMAYYDTVARNILDHGVVSASTAEPFLPSTYRPPLYPAFVAAVRLLAGEQHLVLQLLQCALGTAAVAFVAQAAASIHHRFGRAVLWILALSPYDAVYAGALLSEALTIFFLSAALAVPLVLRTRWRWWLSGCLFGLTALTRDVYMLMIPGYALYAGLFLIREAVWRTRSRAALALLLGGALTIAPWTARNFVVTGAFVPISRSVLARSLWQGTWVVDFAHAKVDANGQRVEYPPWAFTLPGEREDYDRARTLDDISRDRLYGAMFRRRWREMPRTSAIAYVRRAPIVWVGTTRIDIFAFRPNVLQPGRPLYFLVKVALFGTNLIVVMLGFAGICLALRRWNRQMIWFALPSLYSVAVFLPLDLVEPRYTQPVYGTLLLMATYTVRSAAIVWRKRRHSALAS